MLLKGKYDFEPRPTDGKTTLPFKDGDILMFLDTYPKNPSWFKVIDCHGRIGFIPRTYVKIYENINRDTILAFLLEATFAAKKWHLETHQTLMDLCDQVPQQEFRDIYMNRMLQALDFDTDSTTSQTCEGNSSAAVSVSLKSSRVKEEQKNISPQSRDQTDRVISRTPRRDSKSCPQVNSPLHAGNDRGEMTPKTAAQWRNDHLTKSPTTCGKQTPHGSPNHESEVLDREETGNESSSATSSPRSISGDCDQIAADQLVRIVEESTSLGAEATVHRILHFLVTKMTPNMQTNVESLLKQFQSSQTPNPSKVEEIMSYFSSLARSSLHTRGRIEPEDVLLEKLNKLKEEIQGMQGKKLIRVLNPNRFRILHDLISFYEQEESFERTAVRSQILEIFTIVGTLDETARRVMITSVLPLLVAKEFSVETRKQRIELLARTLTTLFTPADSSEGTLLPPTHLEQGLGERFITIVLNRIEHHTDNPEFSEVLMSLILAYNLQFSSSEENLVIKLLALRGNANSARFLEQVLGLLDSDNRSPSRAVFKIMKDLCSSKKTADLFSTLEIKWITDLIQKNVGELMPGDTRRTEWLKILRFILRNRGPVPQKMKAVRNVLVPILLEEDPLSIPDQRIVKQMSKEFPAVFKRSSGIGLPTIHHATSSEMLEPEAGDSSRKFTSAF